VTTNINLPEHKLGQRVLHSDLQILYSHLDDMHKVNPNMEEVMKFYRRLIVKLNWKTSLKYVLD
jgi:GTP1/Obg family GTP-binding protein